MEALYRWYIGGVEEVVGIYINELLLGAYRIIRDRSNCKSHGEVIQCEQQQHRYIVSFDR